MGEIFINDLYFGNVDAQKSKLNSSKLFRKRMEVLSETEKNFSKILTEKISHFSRNTLMHGHLSTLKATEILSETDSD